MTSQDDNLYQALHRPTQPDGFETGDTPVLTGRVQGEAFDRFQLLASGGLAVGPGSSAAAPEPVSFTPGDFVPASGRKFPGRSHLHQAVVAGGAAGNRTVTGITTIDVLTSVIRYIGAGVAVTDVTDLTSQFTITADNTINNTAGTNTTGDKLVVTWQSGAWDGYDQVGLAFPDADTTHAALMLRAPLDWPSVDIHLIGIASGFGSGNVRMYISGDTGTGVTLAVAGSYFGVAFTGVTGFNAVPGFGQILQCPFTRDGTNVLDTLTQDFCVIAVYLTRGA